MAAFDEAERGDAPCRASQEAALGTTAHHAWNKGRSAGEVASHPTYRVPPLLETCDIHELSHMSLPALLFHVLIAGPHETRGALGTGL